MQALALPAEVDILLGSEASPDLVFALRKAPDGSVSDMSLYITEGILDDQKLSEYDMIGWIIKENLIFACVSRPQLAAVFQNTPKRSSQVNYIQLHCVVD